AIAFGVEQPDQNLLTRWSSPDPSAQIMAFYRQELQKNGWKLEGQPIDPTQGILEASRETLQLRVNVQAGSEFTLQVEGLPASDASAPNTSAPNTSTPSPGSSEFIGPISPAIVPSPASSPVATGGFTDLDKAPNELQQPTRDLTQLGVLALPSSNKPI
ncbi:MAG: hypothetical protein HC936_17770, partial [Leptolyngbyaceae cyanobacterium SU_3_3]|nr:hypothetical protein [Leptolyngbyaceae cyanobacterium SU_3_3]